ncbi:MAG TPA: response regulator [Polyangiaceae bacterium]|nr:response regulator [Polyangiaceae bacterium]
MAYTILIVDDSPTTRKYVRGELEQLGHEVVEAIDGTSALQTLERQVPALVISDVNMAPMDGLTLVTHIRQRFSRAELPVLMLTTEAGDDLKAKGRAVGASGWLTKPFDPSRMSAVIAHLLQNRGRTNKGDARE